MPTVLHLISDLTTDLGPILDDMGDRVIIARSSGDVLQEIVRRRPDIIIIPDRNQPVEGMALLPVVRRMTDKPIVLVGQGDSNQQAQSLLQGADAYLTLPLRRATVRSRLRSLLRPRRNRPTSKEIKLDSQKPTPPSVRSFDLNLSPTETRLLSALMSANGALIPAEHLATEVWGEPTKLDSLRFYVSQLRTKLTECSGLRILNQKGLGYRIEFQAESVTV